MLSEFSDSQLELLEDLLTEYLSETVDLTQVEWAEGQAALDLLTEELEARSA